VRRRLQRKRRSRHRPRLESPLRFHQPTTPIRDYEDRGTADFVPAKGLSILRRRAPTGKTIETLSYRHGSFIAMPTSSFPSSRNEIVGAHGMRPPKPFSCLPCSSAPGRVALASSPLRVCAWIKAPLPHVGEGFGVRAGREGVYPCPPGFKKVLNFALISRNLLIK
jgi:hypothetical protein